jgi:hypothetical protein
MLIEAWLSIIGKLSCEASMPVSINIAAGMHSGESKGTVAKAMDSAALCRAPDAVSRSSNRLLDNISFSERCSSSGKKILNFLRNDVLAA